MVQTIEEENELLDSKISSNRFAYMVLKHQYYSELNTKFSALNSNAKREISKIKDLEQHIYTLREDDLEIKNALAKILSSVCTVNDVPIDFGIPANLSLEENLVNECKMLLK